MRFNARRIPAAIFNRVHQAEHPQLRQCPPKRTHCMQVNDDHDMLRRGLSTYQHKDRELLPATIMLQCPAGLHARPSPPGSALCRMLMQ